MKTWALAAVTVVVAGLAVGAGACGNGGSGGAGGSDTTSHASTTSVSSTSTSDPCADGSKCSMCATFQACVMCEEVNHPTGSMLFNELITCVNCTACYTVCDGSALGCAMGPPVKDACDVGMGDGMGTSKACYDDSVMPPVGCIPCAEDGTCKPKVDACKADADCLAFNSARTNCPKN